ncbi:MAG: hypothetical protein KAQ63_02130 [Candidatus Moranbacteria bacterium]|nr:hypothetical protein [Candidatus Moranbacteria bacterium]
MYAEEVPGEGTSFLVSWKADPKEPTVLVRKVEPTRPGEDSFFKIYGEVVKPTKEILAGN